MSLKRYIEERSIPIPVGRGCWLWLLSLGSHGYGNACRGNQITTASRVSFEAFIGSIPDGMLVQHSCDNKWCVNPDHLSLGTDATNAEDKRRKGRAAKKLSPEQRIEIRRLVANGQAIRATAREFSVSQKAIQMVVRSVVG